MAGSTRERQLDAVFGVPTEANTNHISFTASASSTELSGEQLYRMVPTEDCYISFMASGVNVTTGGVLMLSGVPEVFASDADLPWLSVVRKTTNGTLVVTKMTPHKGL